MGCKVKEEGITHKNKGLKKNHLAWTFYGHHELEINLMIIIIDETNSGISL